MSELQVGLLVVGAVVVTAVFLYNKWQERRYQREAEARFASHREDVLMRSGGGTGLGTPLTPGSEQFGPALVSFEAEHEGGGHPGRGLACRPGLCRIPNVDHEFALVVLVRSLIVVPRRIHKMNSDAANRVGPRGFR